MASALGRKLYVEAQIRRSNGQILPGVGPSANLEMVYRNELLRLINSISKEISLVGVDPTSFPTRDTDYPDWIRKILDDIKTAQNTFGGSAHYIGRKVVGKANDINKKAFMNQMRSTFGIDIKKLVERENLAPVLQKHIQINTDLIQSVPTKYLNRVRDAINNTQINGSKESLAKELQKIKDVTISRAKLIARDQAAKLNLALSEARQTNLGIEEYVWVTSKDERVRPEHLANDGKVFRWDDPPTNTGHPGHDVQCRCIAKPVLTKAKANTSTIMNIKQCVADACPPEEDLPSTITPLVEIALPRSSIPFTSMEQKARIEFVEEYRSGKRSLWGSDDLGRGLYSEGRYIDVMKEAGVSGISETINNYSKSQIGALKSYRTFTFNKLQNAMRSGELTPNQLKTISKLDQTFTGEINNRVELYRGMVLNQEEVAKLSVDSIIQSPAYTSTSINVDKVADFVRTKSNKDVPVIMTIRPKLGQKVSFPDAVSFKEAKRTTHTGNVMHEVLLPRNTKMRIVKVKSSKYFVHIEAETID